MTEAQWLTCQDPVPMLDFVRGRASDRKLRLFAAACCRAIWPLFAHEACRKAVEVAERFSDGLATVEELWSAHDDAQRFIILGRREADHATDAARYAASPELFEHHRPGPKLAWVTGAAQRAVASAKARLIYKPGDLIRDVCGDPFRPVLALDDALFAWNDGAVRKMAQAIYDTRAFDRLPLLADALEDAGCTDAGILGHCRSGGEHVRGCWVIDLLLGK